MTKINCSAVEVKTSEICPGEDGAFALHDFKQGELIECGIVRRIPVDGHKCQYIFTWSEDKTVWATTSGCVMFYNCSLTPNTKMIRYFDEDRFNVYALIDIKKGDELTHTYRSMAWRECFEDLRKIEIIKN
jgi:hypothetical protein